MRIVVIEIDTQKCWEMCHRENTMLDVLGRTNEKLEHAITAQILSDKDDRAYILALIK